MHGTPADMQYSSYQEDNLDPLLFLWKEAGTSPVLWML